MKRVITRNLGRDIHIDLLDICDIVSDFYPWDKINDQLFHYISDNIKFSIRESVRFKFIKHFNKTNR